MNKVKQSIEYATWIDTLKWDSYCTFTTRYPLSKFSARKFMERLHEFISKEYPQVKIFWIAEPNDTKYGYHLHALINLNESEIVNADRFIKKAWQVVSNGKGGKEYNNTVIKPYIKGLGGNFYVSEYILRYNSDYDILFNI